VGTVGVQYAIAAASTSFTSVMAAVNLIKAPGADGHQTMCGQLGKPDRQRITGSRASKSH
jgi:hypothetical protein